MVTSYGQNFLQPSQASGTPSCFCLWKLELLSDIKKSKGIKESLKWGSFINQWQRNVSYVFLSTGLIMRWRSVSWTGVRAVLWTLCFTQASYSPLTQDWQKKKKEV